MFLEKKKFKLVLAIAFLAVYLFGLQPNVSAITSTGGEHRDATYDEIWVEYPIDIFFDPSIDEGFVKFPILVRTESHSHDQFPYRWVASYITYDIYIRDYDDNAPETVFDLWDYHIHCDAYGLEVDWSYTIGANVGFDKEPISVGAEIGATWHYSSTAITASDQSNSHWKTPGGNYHLGKVEIDLGDWALCTQMNTITTLRISVSNHNAPNYKYNHYTVYLRVKVMYAAWWLGWSYGVKTYTHNFPTLGNNYPSETDCMFYLLEASDYSGGAE